jgi:DNA-binding transcriptional LysR family regulator
MFARLGLRREIAVEVTDIPTAMELVRAGFGCAFLSRSLTRGAPELPLRRVRPTPMFEVSLVTPADRRISAAASGLVDLFLATAVSHSGTTAG